MTSLPIGLNSCRALVADRSGVALLEFVLSLPVVLGLGLYATETANLALTNLRVSQIALNLADNASRVGETQTNNTQRLREIDIADVLTAARLQGERLDLTNRGRITLSSLENQVGVQMIHWQRCIGMKSGANWDSSYGITATNGRSDGKIYDPTAGRNTSTDLDNSALHPGSLAVGTIGNAGEGMGDAGAKVKAPLGSAVMFVEINYDYKPVVTNSWIAAGSARIHYIASFIIRDNRTLDQVRNQEPKATVYSCDKYTAK